MGPDAWTTTALITRTKSERAVGITALCASFGYVSRLLTEEQRLGGRTSRLARPLLFAVSVVLLAFVLCIDMIRPLSADGHLSAKAPRKTLKTAG